MPALYPVEILSDASTLVETICPEKILLIGEAIHQVADPYIAQCEVINKPCDITRIKSSTPLSDHVFLQRYDLAVVSEVLELDNKQQAEHILGRLRDLCSPRIILITELENSLWKENELFGFGFNKHDQQRFIDHSVSIYHHNIDSYKRTPDWFNPKHWANPELWNKFWW